MVGCLHTLGWQSAGEFPQTGVNSFVSFEYFPERVEDHLFTIVHVIWINIREDFC